MPAPTDPLGAVVRSRGGCRPILERPGGGQAGHEQAGQAVAPSLSGSGVVEREGGGESAPAAPGAGGRAAVSGEAAEGGGGGTAAPEEAAEEEGRSAVGGSEFK